MTVTTSETTAVDSWSDYSVPWTPVPLTTVITPYIQPQTEELKKIHDAVRKLYKQKEENIMKIFEIYVIDKKECEVIIKKDVIAADKEKAMLELDLTPEMKKKVRKNEIEFIFSEKGQFAKIEPRLKLKKELIDEEE
jgi:hypothetical protein